MLNKQESINFVTSCYQVESCVLDVNIDKVWNSFRSFEFEKLFPSHIRSVIFTSGGPNEVGAVFDVEYVDGSVWTNKIGELSEVRRVISWEIISAQPVINFTSMLTTIRFHKITEDNRTFLSWESDYSNDVNSHIVQDGNFKKLEYFKDLRNLK
jgi:hypothetical protein